MKLLSEITYKQEPVELKIPSQWAKIKKHLSLGLRDWQPKDFICVIHYPGIVQFDPVTIDFEVPTTPEEVLGTKIDAVIIGNKTLQGVLPIMHVRDSILWMLHRPVSV